MLFQRLLPDPGPVELAALLAGLGLGERAPADRPYVVANFVATLDGHVTVGGRSGPIGDDGDTELFHALRGQVDAVLVGTGTLATEHYGRLAARPERRAAREALGLAPDPLGVTLTRSGVLPAGIPLLADEHSTLVVYAGADVSLDPGTRARVEVVGDADPARVLAHLSAEHGVRSVLCEGGPTLLAALTAAGLVDELFLTVAPLLAGGGGTPGLTAGSPLAIPVPLELRWVLERAGSLYLRHALARVAG